MTDRSKTKVGLFVFIYAAYAAFIAVCELFDYLCFQIGWQQGTPISVFLALSVMASIIFILVRKEFIVLHLGGRKSPVFYTVAGFIIVYSLVRSLLPDTSFDSTHYHFFNIFPGFIDKIDYYVMPQSQNTFLFKLGNRMFYYFYLLFGYRWGTVLNAIVMIMSYSAFIDIVKLILNERIQKQKNSSNSFKKICSFFFRPEVFSLLAVSTYLVSANIAIYFVDLLPVPFFLEMLRLTIISYRERDKQVKKNFELLYFATISGLCFAIKLTNLAFILPLLAVYLYANYKKLSIKLLLSGIIIALIPALPYLSHSYFSTGNPLWPFYNTFFKGDYYPYSTWRYTVVGPRTWIEYLLWPILLVFYTHRYTMLHISNQYVLFLGLLSALSLPIISHKTEKCREHRGLYILLVGVFIASLYIWVISSGNGRFSLALDVFSGILVFCLITELRYSRKPIKRIRNKKTRSYIIPFVNATLISLFIIQFAITHLWITVRGVEWSWRPSVLKYPRTYIDNISYTFFDKGLIGSPEQRDRIDAFVQFPGFSNLSCLLAPDVPVINFGYMSAIPSVPETNMRYRTNVLNRVMIMQDEGQGLYCPIFNSGFSDLHENLNRSVMENRNLYIYDVEVASSFFEPHNYVLLVRTGIEENKKNTLHYAYESESVFSLSSLDNTGNARFTGLVALVPYITWEWQATNFEIVADNGVYTQIVYSQPVEKLEFYGIDIVLDFSGLDGDVEFFFRHTNAHGLPEEPMNLTITNAIFEL